MGGVDTEDGTLMDSFKRGLARGPLKNQSVQEFKEETRYNRDPQSLHDNVKIQFSDIIAEPQGYHSAKYIWNMSQTIYSWAKTASYELMSGIFGVPMSLLWGCLFAVVACMHVWIYAPMKSSHQIKMGCWSHFWSIIVKSCCDPIFESAGKTMSHVHIHTEKIIV